MAGPRPKRSPWAPAARAVRRVPDVAVTVLAVWTVCYHLALVLGFGLTALEVLWVVVTAAAAAVVAVVGWRSQSPRRTAAPVSAGLAAVAAVLFAALSLVLKRPDTDDIVYVGRSVAVAELGVIPTRDTVFSAGVLPPVASQFPPVTSWETLLGAAARASGLQAGSVVYLVAPPIGAALAVLALHRLLVSWQVAAPGLALVAALVFVLWGGAEHASFGNLHVGRIWQGKVVFLAFVVPYLYAVGTDWLRERSRASLLLMAVASVAAVGLTTTAFLVVPVMGAVLVLAALSRRDLGGALGACVPAVYPAGAAVVSVLVPGASTLPPSAAPQTAEILTFVLGTGIGLLVPALALLTGWAGARGPGRRVAVLTVLVTAAVLAPASLTVVDDVTGAGEILWRLTWVTPLPALVGAAVSLLYSAPRRPLLGAASTALGLAVLVATGHPLWASDNEGASLTGPSWKVPAAELTAAREIVATARATGAEGPVLAPTTTSYAISLVSARVHPVVSRSTYMAQLALVPRGHLDERLLLQSFADGHLVDQRAPQVLSAMSRLGVEVACVAGDGEGEQVLARVGWVRVGRTPTCMLFTSPRADGLRDGDDG